MSFTAGRGSLTRPRSLVSAALLVPILIVLLALRIGPRPVLVVCILFALVAVALALIDVAEHRLPNVIVLPSFAVAVALLTLTSLVDDTWPVFLGALLGSLAMFALYLAVALISPSSLGMGDVKLAALIGLILGYRGLEVWMFGLCAAFILGGLAALALLVTRRTSMRRAIPFGPPMLAGALLALLA